MAEQLQDKLIEQIGAMSVVELSDLIKKIEETFGVSAAMPTAAAGAAQAAAPVEAEKSEYKVTLQDIGSNKIAVIKALKAVITTLSLSEAKEKVESAPSVVLEAAPKADAEKIKKELEAAGAKVVLS